MEPAQQELRQILYRKLLDGGVRPLDGPRGLESTKSDVFSQLANLQLGAAQPLHRTGSAPPQLDEAAGSPFTQDGQLLSLLGSSPTLRVAGFSRALEGASFSGGGASDRDTQAADPALVNLLHNKAVSSRIVQVADHADNIRAHWLDGLGGGVVGDETAASSCGGDGPDDQDGTPLSGTASPAIYSAAGLDGSPAAHRLTMQSVPGTQPPDAAINMTSWSMPGAGATTQPNIMDAELPFFPGKPIRTASSLLSHGVQRTGSFSGVVTPTHVHSSLSRENSFTQEQIAFNGSAPLTPHTPATALFADMMPGMSNGHQSLLDPVDVASYNLAPPSRTLTMDRQPKPSKLRISSYDSDAPAAGAVEPFPTVDMGLQPSQEEHATSAPLASVPAAPATLMPAQPPGQRPLPRQRTHAGQPRSQGQSQQPQHPSPVQLPLQPPCHQQQCGHPRDEQQVFSGMQPCAIGYAAGAMGMSSTVPTAQQLHAMYMAAAAAMYPYYAQTAGLQATGLFPAFPPPTMMGFTGVPPPFPSTMGPMGPSVPATAGDASSTLPHAASFSHAMPFGMPAPAEYAAYYQKMVHLHTAAMQQVGNPASTMAIATAAAAAAAAAAASTHEDKDGGVAAVKRQDAGNDRATRGAGERDRGARRGGGAQRNRRDDSEPASARADPLLEEFKTSKSRKFEMRDVLGHMLEFSLDQHGSRFIQQKLDTLTPEELTSAFMELGPKSLTLMNDVFGNYVIQKLLELGPDAHRAVLIGKLKGQVLNLSLQMYGCRVIQKALEMATLEQQQALCAELENHVMRCVRDQNGNHVVQKVIECVPTAHIGFILDTVYGQIVPLSMHPFGCRVVQRILEHCSDPSKYAAIMEEILQATVPLAQDQYGNYVIQHVIEFGKAEERSAAIGSLTPHIVALSQHKFASNVVEKCLLCAQPSEKQMLISEMLQEGSEPGTDAEPLQKMMKDQFGNYVVQKLLEVCNEEQREVLLARVRTHLSSLKKYTYGKHIVVRVEKLLSTGTRMQSGVRVWPSGPASSAVLLGPPSSCASAQCSSASADCASEAANGAATSIADMDDGPVVWALDVTGAAAAGPASILKHELGGTCDLRSQCADIPLLSHAT